MKSLALVRGLRGLLRAEPASREQVLEYQLACLQEVVRRAYGEVPYYRRLFDGARIRPGDIRSIGDLAAIPITARSDIQLLPPSETCASSCDPESLRAVMTSGSTGAPLIVRRTLTEERLLLAFRARAVRSFGFGLGVRHGVIDHVDANFQGDGSRPQLYQRMGIMPRVVIDWHTPKDDILRKFGEFRPHIIGGPPSLLADLADELTEQDRRRLTAELVRTGAETMTPRMRQRIEQGFGVPVIDTIGSHEVVFIAMQRLHKPEYRICEEAVLVEVLRDGQPVAPGGSGELVVTALHSFAMPFIRYRLGDEVVAGPCTGAYSTLQAIEGRTIDRFTLPSGRVVHGYVLGEQVETSGLEVQRFQITQERRDCFRVRLKLRASPPAGLAALSDALRSCLEPCVEVHVNTVDSLDRGDSRKFYPFVSFERLEAWRSTNVPKNEYRDHTA
jgi:phenylacetate-CoA ligase